MEILPAIDLRDGHVVRLARGDYARQTTYSDDPLAVAQAFVQAGAAWIHVVDLDAARTGRLKNFPVVGTICGSVGARIELGGGARDEVTIEKMLRSGVSRVVVGSKALNDWDWFERLVRREDLEGSIALGLDARGGRLASHGWTQQTDLTAVEIAERTKGWPIGAIVYTDIGRDGMLSGANIEATAAVVDATDVPVIASGGICSLEDLAECKRTGCAGAIIGTAYYEGKIDLQKSFDSTQGWFV